MVLERTGDDPAAVEHGGGVVWRTLRPPDLVDRALGPVEIAADDHEVAQPGRAELGREVFDRGAGGLDERRPKGKILDGVAGKRHFGKCDDVGAAVGGVVCPPHDGVRVAGDVTDRDVELRECQADLGHAPRVVGHRKRQGICASGRLPESSAVGGPGLGGAGNVPEIRPHDHGGRRQ